MNEVESAANSRRDAGGRVVATAKCDGWNESSPGASEALLALLHADEEYRYLDATIGGLRSLAMHLSFWGTAFRGVRARTPSVTTERVKSSADGLVSLSFALALVVLLDL